MLANGFCLAEVFVQSHNWAVEAMIKDQTLLLQRTVHYSFYGYVPSAPVLNSHCTLPMVTKLTSHINLGASKTGDSSPMPARQ